MDEVQVALEEGDKLGPEAWVLPCELGCQRGEDELEVTAILKTS